HGSAWRALRERQQFLAGGYRIDVNPRSRARQQLSLPGGSRRVSGNDHTLAVQTEEQRKTRQGAHARRLRFARPPVHSHAHAARALPTLAWKSRPLPVRETNLARIANSPKRSPGRRFAA